MSTDYLYAKPTFVRGIGSILDLSGRNVYNESASEVEADRKAISSDWAMVGNDMRKALNEYEQAC